MKFSMAITKFLNCRIILANVQVKIEIDSIYCSIRMVTITIAITKVYTKVDVIISSKEKILFR